MLDGKVAVVTGGGRGLGREHALALGRAGARVVVNDVGFDLAGSGEREAVAQQVASEITAAGGEAVAHTEDVSDFAAAESLIEQARATWGRLDVVVNNAGIIRDRVIFNMTEDDWDSVLRVHLKHVFNTTRHACAYWRQESKEGRPVAGRVINTTSTAGLLGNPGQANYSSAKAAIAAFGIVVAQEMYRYGVTVNAISPAARTRMVVGLGNEEPAEGEFDAMDPANVSPLVVYLASDDAAWLTGQVLRIRGGQINRYEGWSIGATIDEGKRFDAASLGLTLRKLYGAMPLGMAAAPSAHMVTGLGGSKLAQLS